MQIMCHEKCLNYKVRLVQYFQILGHWSENKVFSSDQKNVIYITSG